MKILATYITDSAQIHNGKCYFIGVVSETGKDTDAYNVEVSTSAASANKVGYARDGKSYILPKPGVECNNGLYVTATGDALIYYAL
ncbi:unnamed protein product [marine sediment metagenome]|uniref:Uncharacterized protein n=1 Tax=marine sediment metagenome TaxID=412755 RepID=X0VSP6_9ZZZZ